MKRLETVAAALFMLLIAQGCSDTKESEADRLTRLGAEGCLKRMVSMRSEYEALLQAKSYLKASTLFGACPVYLKDPGLAALSRQAALLNLEALADNTAGQANERMDAILQLRRLDPVRGTKYDKAYETLTADWEREAAARQKLVELSDAKRKKAEAQTFKNSGVELGMSRERVLMSSWGKPKKINRTTSIRSGEHEQWVYEGGYLYFEGGVLTAIQN